MKVTIRNEFTNQSTTVDASRPLTSSKVRAIRRRLCRPDCRSGDTLGGFGRQDDGEAYLALLERAESVLVTGADES